MVPIEQFYDGGEEIMNGAPPGSTILGATVNSGFLVGVAYAGASGGVYIGSFWGGEAAEPLGGGFLAMEAVWLGSQFLPSPQVMGQAITNYYSSPTWPPL